MKKILVLAIGFLMILSLAACGGSSNSTTKKSYDYDKGYGYTAPKEGESFSDYVKRQDPDLYDSMQER